MKHRETVKAYLFLAPALALAFTFLLYPLLKAFIDSFLRINAKGDVLGFAGLDNYIQLLTDPGFLSAVKNTLRFTIIFVPLNTVLTLTAAALTRQRRKFTPILEFIFASPIIFSLSASALIFKELFRGRVSVINRIFGLDIEWLSEGGPAMMVLVLLGVFLDFGLDYLLLVNAFRANDKSVLEAAMLDGAKPGRMFFSIELPMISNILKAVIFLALKDAIMISAPVIILTEGGPFRTTETIMFYYYIEAFKSGNKAVQSTLSVMMVTITALSMWLYRRRREK